MTKAWQIVAKISRKPALWDGRMQIFWHRKVAQKALYNFGGSDKYEVVSCEVT